MSIKFLDTTALSRLVNNLNSRFITSISLSGSTLTITKGDGTSTTITLDVSSSPEASSSVIEEIVDDL